MVLDKRECRNCRCFDGDRANTEKEYRGLCKASPHVVEKKPDDWCMYSFRAIDLPEPSPPNEVEEDELG